MKRVVIFVSMIMVVLFSSCKKEENVKEILGAGATFPNPLYVKMFDEYHNKTSIMVNYQAIGSGGGIKQLMEKTIDFGATDAYLTDEELKASAEEVLHIPTCIGGVVLVYNIPNVSADIKLSGLTLSKIFMGEITKWNDYMIKADNIGVELPDLNITVVNRADSSGTTFIFTDYLTKASPEWESKVGRGKSVNWLAKNIVSGKGNPGVASLVGQLSGSIGYVEISFAIQNSLKMAHIKNKSGYFVKPTLDTISLAGEVEIPSDTRVTITDSAAEMGYPIVSFTWLIFYKEQNYNNRSKKQAEALYSLLKWIVKDGQEYCKPLDYSPLPLNAVERTNIIIDSITFGGKTISEGKLP